MLTHLCQDVIKHFGHAVPLSARRSKFNLGPRLDTCVQRKVKVCAGLPDFLSPQQKTPPPPRRSSQAVFPDVPPSFSSFMWAQNWVCRKTHTNTQGSQKENCVFLASSVNCFSFVGMWQQSVLFPNLFHMLPVYACLVFPTCHSQKWQLQMNPFLESFS